MFDRHVFLKMRKKFNWDGFLLLHCNENPSYVFPEKKLSGLSPYFHIHVSVSDLYIFPGSVHIFSCSRTGIVGIYKSLTDTWMWKLGLRLRNSIFFLEFSLQCGFEMSDVKAKLRQQSTEEKPDNNSKEKHWKDSNLQSPDPMKPEARGLAQHGDPPGCLEENGPAGCVFVHDERSMPPALTDCPGLGLICY
jgi:hypothetical protein